MKIEIAHYTNADHTVMHAVVDGKTISNITPGGYWWNVIHEAASFDIGAYVPDPPPEISALVGAISRESERRIREGLVIPGVGQFVCDDRSIGRITAMYVGAKRYDELGQQFTYTFRTAAEKVVSLETFAEVDAVFGVVQNHVTATLTRSAHLQASVSSMMDEERRQFDPSDDANWVVPE